MQGECIYAFASGVSTALLASYVTGKRCRTLVDAMSTDQFELPTPPEPTSGNNQAYEASMERLRKRISSLTARAYGEAQGLPGEVSSASENARGAGMVAGAKTSSAGRETSASGTEAEVEALLAGLNPQQREAVTHRGSPLLVVAGAGSGKTRVLTSRIAYLLATGAAWAGEILAITFTNKAAREMRERIEAMVPHAGRMWISTFHSACVRILREQHEAVGMTSSFTIYDAQDSARLMKTVCKEEGIDVRVLSPKDASYSVSDLKNQLIGPAEYARTANDGRGLELSRAYKAYQERLHAASACDFDDLIMLVVQLLERNSDILDYYRRRFRHILVDEYQDTNHAQYRLVRLLAGSSEEEGHGELMVVGDADQSIYAFRGATVRNIEDFEKDFPDAHVVTLEQNYRSTQPILSAANAVIAHNTGRRVKNLWTDNTAGEKLEGFVADSPSEESAYIVRTIDRLRDEGYSYGDVAVFYRTNAAARPLEEMFLRTGVPYRVIGGTRFYERAEIKDALAYISLILNPADEVAFRRVVNTPRRGIGQKALGVVLADAAIYGLPATLERAHEGQIPGLTGKAKAGMEAFAQVLHVGRQLWQEDADPADILDTVMDASGYTATLAASSDPQDESRLENLAELHTVAVEFLDRLDLIDDTAGSKLQAWLEQIALVSDTDQLDEGGEGDVTLMTVHTAKGLEFPIVFVTGMEDGNFPHIRSLSDARELAEERRLAYVALTRAKKRLFLTRAVYRSSFGAAEHFPPSRFLDEIPEELITWSGAVASAPSYTSASYQPRYGSAGRAGHGGQEFDDGYFDDSGDYSVPIGSGKRSKPLGRLGVSSVVRPGGAASGRSKAAPSGSPAYDFSPGDRVRHKSFGVGSIVEIEGSGTSMVARVAFRSGAVKRLMLRYAPLEKLG